MLLFVQAVIAHVSVGTEPFADRTSVNISQASADVLLRSELCYGFNSVLVLHIDLQLQLAANDRLESERLHSKNSVEEYVYEIRDKLFSDYEPYITETVCSALLVAILL